MSENIRNKFSTYRHTAKPRHKFPVPKIVPGSYRLNPETRRSNVGMSEDDQNRPHCETQKVAHMRHIPLVVAQRRPNDEKKQ